jgi:aspartate/methionine/tyrosine aminotransferase
MLSMYSLIISLLNPGDECLLSLPGFLNYQQTVAIAHAKSIPYICHPKNGFLPKLVE